MCWSAVSPLHLDEMSRGELYESHRTQQLLHVARSTTPEERIHWIEQSLAALAASGVDVHARRLMQEQERLRQFWLDKGMHALGDVWKFTRFRLTQSIQDLTDEHMRWRPHENCHSIGELIYHIAGCEHYWAVRINAVDPASDEYQTKLDSAARDGFLREAPSPFSEPEMTRELIDQALEYTYNEIAPIYQDPTQEQLQRPMISPIGDDVNGYEGLVRLAQHAGYHTGQIWIYRMDPRFPK